MGHLNLSEIIITGRPGRRVQFHLHIQAVQGSIPDQDVVYPDCDYRGMAQSLQIQRRPGHHKINDQIPRYSQSNIHIIKR